MTDLTADAKYLMNNEAFVEALESAKRQALTAALACDVRDDEGRRRYLDAIRTVDKVRGHLAALATTTDTDNVADFYEDRQRSALQRFLNR